MAMRIMVVNPAAKVFALLIFNHYSTLHNDPMVGRSIVFASFAINSMVYIFAYRSLRKPLTQMVPLKENMYLIWTVLLGIATALLPFLIPGLGAALGVVPLTPIEWANDESSKLNSNKCLLGIMLIALKQRFRLSLTL